MPATTQLAMTDVKAEKGMDWVISSRADAKAPEGSTTTRSSLKPLIRQMYEGGKTCREIEGETGIPSRTVARWLKEIGANVRKPGQRGAHVFMTADWLMSQYVIQDKSAERIAAENDVTARTVRLMLVSAGIEIRHTNKGRKFDDAMHRAHSNWLKGRYVGDKNPNWRGDAVPKYRRERNSAETKAWAAAVKARDGNKCVKCGAVERLHAHHIKRWRQNPALRFDLSNGMTLCKACHDQEHAHEIAHGWATGKGKKCTSTRHP